MIMAGGATGSQNPHSSALDDMSALQIATLMNDKDTTVPAVDGSLRIALDVG